MNIWSLLRNGRYTDLTTHSAFLPAFTLWNSDICCPILIFLWEPPHDLLRPDSIHLCSLTVTYRSGSMVSMKIARFGTRNDESKMELPLADCIRTNLLTENRNVTESKLPAPKEWGRLWIQIKGRVSDYFVTDNREEQCSRSFLYKHTK